MFYHQLHVCRLPLIRKSLLFFSSPISPSNKSGHFFRRSLLRAKVNFFSNRRSLGKRPLKQSTVRKRFTAAFTSEDRFCKGVIERRTAGNYSKKNWQDTIPTISHISSALLSLVSLLLLFAKTKEIGEKDISIEKKSNFFFKTKAFPVLRPQRHRSRLITVSQ